MTRARRALVATGLALLVVAVTWGGGARQHRAHPAIVSGDAMSSVQAALDAEARHDLPAAFALYEAAAARFPNDAYVLGSYAIALNNRSYAVQMNRGRLMPLATTSRRRVAEALRTLRLLDAAGRANPSLAGPALYRGRLYAAWGFPEDALDQFEIAFTQGDRSPELEHSASELARLQLAPLARADQNGRPASR